MDVLAKTLDVDLLQLSYALALIGVFPLALIHRRIQNVTVKHIYSFIAGFGLAWFVFGVDSLHFLFSSTVVYALVATLPVKVAPHIVFLFCMIHLSYGQIKRMYDDYLGYSLDWSVPQMLLCCKLTSFAWDYYDGHISREQWEKQQSDKLNDRTKFQIHKLPSPLEFFAWVYFFAGFLTGPFASFQDYIAFTNRTMFADNNYQIPTSYRSTFLKIALAVVSYFGIKMNDHYPELYTITPEFDAQSLLYRLLYVWFSVETGFFKYYFVFSLGEAGANVTGISYNGKDSEGNAKWDRIRMMRLWEFKTAQNGRHLVELWNIPCQQWLKHYVFTRLKILFPVNIARTLTYFTSAVWHGFYPGYYLFFLSGALIDPLTISLNKNLRWRFINKDGSFKKSKILYDFAGWLTTFYTIDYLTLSFRLLSLQYALKAWSSVYFIGHVGVILLLVFFYAFGDKSVKPREAIKPEQGVKPKAN